MNEQTQDPIYLDGVIAKARLQELPAGLIIESVKGEFGTQRGTEIYEGVCKIGGYGNLNYRTARNERPVLDCASLAGAEAHQIERVEERYRSVSESFLKDKLATLDAMYAATKDPQQKERILAVIDKTRRMQQTISARKYQVEYEVVAMKKEIDNARLRWERAEKFYFDMTKG